MNLFRAARRLKDKKDELPTGPTDGLYQVAPEGEVLILTYGCELLGSHEHNDGQFFDLGELPGLVLPAGYKRTIERWLAPSRLSAWGHEPPR